MYAKETLPPHLKVQKSNIPNAGLGVFTKKKLDINTRFGPYTGVKIDIEEIDGKDPSYMWEVRHHYLSLVVNIMLVLRSFHASTYLTNSRQSAAYICLVITEPELLITVIIELKLRWQNRELEGL